ncbi:MAG: S9 family peptidase [Prevotella sp.]|nr:S9 family peptidase [Prevotella sp.]
MPFCTAQEKTTVAAFLQAGPYAVSAPFALDTVDVQGKKFDDNSLMSAIGLTAPATQTFSGAVLPSLPGTKSVGVLSFYLNNSSYLKGRIEVAGPKNCKLYIDGVEKVLAGTPGAASGELMLAPEHHTFAIRYLAEPSDTDSIRVTLDTPQPVVTTTDKRHPYMVHDLTDGKRVRGISLSADGKLACVSYQTTERGGNSRWDFELRDVKTGRLLSRPSHSVSWMPTTTAWLEEEQQQGLRVLYKVNPMTGERTRWASGVPNGHYVVSPTEDYLIVSAEEEGPQEDGQVFQVVEMDDRQPGWRKRSYLMKYDVATGISQRLTFGTKGEYLADISQDGRKLLVSSNYSRLTKRPTEVQDVFLLDVQTQKVDTVLRCEGFLGGCSFSPDASQILFTGTPEAFGRIGCQLPADRTPSMTENELFLYDIATRQVTPLTKDFDPSIDGGADWSWADGKIYFRAECRDYVFLYQLDPKTGKIQQLPCSGDDVYRFDMASRATTLAWLSYKTLEPASAYVASQPGAKSCRTLFDGKTALGDAEVGTCRDWNFTNSNGDTVYGRLYLPKELSDRIADSSPNTQHSSLNTQHSSLKKYPMIVYYYGGCSPVSRYFESPYAPQYWNSLGYVAYIIEPSGATGFGQEWASRHVNTAGGTPREDGTVPGGTPAGDIIEGVKRICQEHPFIDAAKIGCMGASYGGFMTQYLQTVTDIFAAAVSHAGIANHTSYWGEGYWGYNYSEVSMAGSYPWSHRQLYVDQSPLFRADKIHTPLLLLHGTADTNVPIIESLQMFTALKLLGREVALVEVEGENHHILDYQKREKWLATQMAWFQKWLKGDPSWWDTLYPKKNL